jgi:hypothetical protein
VPAGGPLGWVGSIAPSPPGKPGLGDSRGTTAALPALRGCEDQQPTVLGVRTHRYRT